MIAAGLARGTMELRHVARRPGEVVTHALGVLVFVVLAAIRKTLLPGGDATSDAVVLGGAVAVLILLNAWVSLPQSLALDREDGTLLRMRCVPHGPGVHLVGRLVQVGGLALGSVLIVSAAVWVVAPASAPGPARLGLLLLFVGLGLLATLPWGAVLGALLPNPREAMGILMLPVSALILTSGMLFPVSRMPRWLEGVVSVFPTRWLTDGTVAALVGGGDTGHLVLAAGVLAAWAVAGLLTAPSVLSRRGLRLRGDRVPASKVPA